MQCAAGRDQGVGQVSRAAEAIAKLDAYGVDAVCADIGDQMSLTAIAKAQGVSIGSLLTWCEADPERSARVREARTLMARYWDERAEVVISEAKDDFELKKARELAHHYRWRGSKIAPKEYGDKMTLAGDPESPLQGVTDAQLDARLNELLRKAEAGP